MERSPELRNVILGIFHDLSSGDPTSVDGIMSRHDETLVIGTDPDEWWHGGDVISAIWREQIREVGPYKYRLERVEAWSEGSAGWGTALVHRTAASDPVRFTFVFHRELDGWRIVHGHASVARRNVELMGKDLTTSIDTVAELVEQERPDLESVASPEGTLTIMFTDIEASTATNEALGDDRFLPLLMKHNAIVESHVRSSGGTVVKSQGDGYMLVFPSARRGVDCAMNVQRDVETLDSTIRIRMGLHTGEPRRHADDFFGRDVAYAARLGAAALGGEILVSSVVRTLVQPSGSVRFEGPRELELKGFEGRQLAYDVVWR